MQFLLLVYNDTTLLDALPEGRFDTMMKGCLEHADQLQREGTLLGFGIRDRGALHATVLEPASVFVA